MIDIILDYRRTFLFTIRELRGGSHTGRNGCLDTTFIVIQFVQNDCFGRYDDLIPPVNSRKGKKKMKKGKKRRSLDKRENGEKKSRKGEQKRTIRYDIFLYCC